MFEDHPSTGTTGAQILTVSQLNQAVGRLLEKNFALTWVSGELSNVTRAASGHWYFTLKDAHAQVRAVMFRGRAQYVDFNPREGDKVEVRATVGLYAARGDFQLNVETMRKAGVGHLYEAFLRLKAKLAAEGLFDEGRKRELPDFPRTIGIVTSPQAAALRDVLTTFRRRAPHIALVLYPTAVQGEGSAEKIAEAIHHASRRAECDLLIVCRGGGSLEDLWSFNDEQVARAIAACRVPVISGVGHETDVSIADFVADLRAPTPTAAAELAAAPTADWLAELEEFALGLGHELQRQLGERAQTLDWLARRLHSPSTAIHHHKLALSGLAIRLSHATSTPVNAARYRLGHVTNRLRHAMPDTRMARARVTAAATHLHAAFSLRAMARQHTLVSAREQLELLAPQRTLERGYAIVSDGAGKILRRPSELRAPQRLVLTLAEGKAAVDISAATPED
ncbi:MAG: exodeoxyribonuclease VII large subunit [Oxalobacteraceae bacterium]